MNARTAGKSPGDLERPGWTDAIVEKEVFVSLDVDLLNPSIAPGTGTPENGGLSLRQPCQFLARIAKTTRPVGFDLIDLCPMRDQNDLSARVVIEALLCLLAVLFDAHLRAEPALTVQPASAD